MPTKIHIFVSLLPVLTALACGPAGVGGEATTTDTQSSNAGTLESSDTNTDPTGTSETETGATGTESLGFGPPHDNPVLPCDSFMQDCPEGEKCVFYGSVDGSWDSTKCVPIMGDQAAGEPCTSDGMLVATDDCDATSFCWNVQDVEGEALGTCVAMCLGNANDPECPMGSSCLVNSGPVALCFTDCDPIIQDCGAGQACYWTNNTFSCIYTIQAIPAGQPCGFLNDCAAGASCLSGEQFPDCVGTACCAPFCDINLGDAQCDAVPGTSCVAFFSDPPPAGQEHIGVCILP